MKEKLPFIIYIGIGAVLMAASLPHMDGYYGNMVFWVGFGTVCTESVQLFKYCWWRAPHTKTPTKPNGRRPTSTPWTSASRCCGCGRATWSTSSCFGSCWGWILCWRC